MVEPTEEPKGVLLPIDFAIGGIVEGQGLLQPPQVRTATEALVSRRSAGEQLDLATVFVEQNLLPPLVATQIRQIAQLQVTQKLAAQVIPAPISGPAPATEASGAAPPPEAAETPQAAETPEVASAEASGAAPPPEAAETPQAAETPEVASAETPEVASAETPEAPEVAPAAEAPEAPKVAPAAEAPKVAPAAEAPEVAAEAPEVAAEAPEVAPAAEAPEVAAEAPEVAPEAPEVAAEAPEAPEVAAEAPEVAAEAPEVPAEAPEVAAEASEVAAEAPEAPTPSAPSATAPLPVAQAGLPPLPASPLATGAPQATPADASIPPWERADASVPPWERADASVPPWERAGAPVPPAGPPRESAEPSAPSSRRPSSGSHVLPRPTSQRLLAARESEGLPLPAKIGASLGVLAFALIGGAALFMGSKPGQSAGASPTSSPTPTSSLREAEVTPTASQGSLSPRMKALIIVHQLESREDYRGALEKLNAIPKDVRGPAFDSKRARLKRFAEYSEDLTKALAQGKEDGSFQRWIEKIEGEEVEEDLAVLPATARFRQGAQELAGADYSAMATGDYEGEDDDDDDDEMPWEVEREIERLGSEERRARMKEEAAQGQARVASARESLTQEAISRKKGLAAETERAKAKCTNLKVPIRKDRSVSGRLVSYEELGFTVDVGRETRRFSWLGGPPELVCGVLEAALDPESVSDQWRLLRLACLRGQTQVANRARDRLKGLDPKATLPDPESFRALGNVLQVGTLTESKLEANYVFASELEGHDFTDLPGGQSEVKDKRLRLVASLPGFIPAAAYLDATLKGDATFVVEGDPGPKGRLLLIVGGKFLVANETGIAITDERRLINGVALKGPGVKLSQAFVVELKFLGKVKFLGQVATVSVKQDGKLLFSGPVDWTSEHYVGLGGTGPLTHYKRFEIRAQPDPAWLVAAKAKIPFDRELSYRTWKWSQTKQPDLSLVYSKTSAEDPECVAELPPLALEQFSTARSVLAAAGEAYATDVLREAINTAGGRGFWAAEYLLARIEIQEAEHATSLGGARIRLDQAIAGVDDFYEAYTARSELLLKIGAIELARKDAERALAIRPDYAPARSAMAYVLLQEGRVENAIAEIRLARALSGRLKWELQEERLVAALEGPTLWNDFTRVETPHYILTTNLAEKRAEFETVLKRYQTLAPKIFPCLTPRPGSQARRARVYVFATSEGYRRYCYQIFFDRNEATAGVFSPLTGNLQVDASARDAVATLQHEMTHQWVHGMGLELPYWANEAVADYVGGYDPVTKTSELDLEKLGYMAELAEPPMDLFDLMTLSPAQFYAGDTYLNYCLAWSFIRFCMEGKDEKLKETLFSYLKLHNEGPAGDPKRQTGTALEYTYASTFHQLDMKAIQAAWWRYTKDLCLKHPLKKPSDDKAPEQPTKDDNAPEQPTRDDKAPEQPTEDDKAPEQPTKDDNAPEQPTKDDNAPEQPTKDDNAPEQPTKDDKAPEQPTKDGR